MPLGSLVIDLTLHLFGFLMEGYSHWITIDLRHRLMLEMPISVFAAAKTLMGISSMSRCRKSIVIQWL